MPQPQTNHTAIVTGAATGIGQTFCQALARAGITVVGVDLSDMADTATLVEAENVAFYSFISDVADLDAMKTGINRMAETTGGFDIVVANAGIYPAGPFEEVTLEQWREIMRVNLDGVFCTVQSALPHLRKRGWGRIIVQSSASIWVGVPQQTPYVTSKAALLGFVRSLAGEVAEDGITVNAITPGLIETEHVKQTVGGMLFDWVVGAQVIKRRMQPSDLVSTLMYLVDEGSDLVTGQAINVDGGLGKH